MAVTRKLDFASAPPMFLLPTNLPADEMHDLEDAIAEAGGQLSYDAKEARIFVGRLSQKRRATFELRSRDVWLEESVLPTSGRKRRKLNEHDRKSFSTIEAKGDHDYSPEVDGSLPELSDHVVVLKLQWLQKSLEAGQFQPYQPYLVYAGRIVEKPQNEPDSPSSTRSITYIKARSEEKHVAAPDTHPTGPNESGSSLATILNQTKASSDGNVLPVMSYSPRRFRDQRHGHRATPTSSHPTLKRTTTSEHEFLASAEKQGALAPIPSWMLEPHPRANYACCRSTFANPPNAAFLQHLYKIKEARLLTLDEIGVRAYSTSIASLSAYPHKITYPAEITRLPGCSDKIAALWVEWYASAEPAAADSQRRLKVTDDLDRNEDLKHLKTFYDIWGVGADTARKFYYEYGWKDIDDAVEFGWHSGALNRVQQIGVKFYDDFMVKIPRPGVEEIADVILRHARLCRDIPEAWWSNKRKGYGGNWAKADNGCADPDWDPRDMVCVIVGGYRRGKLECGDVDVILSHRDEDVTKDLVVDVVKSLEDEGWITHTLTLHTTNSNRDQQTLPYRAVGHAGHGFDTLDKALCVWQDPTFDEKQHEKNPNIHRRVDIIVSPWRTVGAAVLGWSGATTFERDVRRWCRKEKGWKFDSSGVRDRGDGVVLDFESPRTQRNGKQREGEEIDDGDGWEDRERRLMDGIGIGWRPAVERCTG